MDVTQLRGISKTAPYFHNNSTATLEEVIDHYIALFAFVARRFPPPNLPPILSSNGLIDAAARLTSASIRAREASLVWILCISRVPDDA